MNPYIRLLRLPDQYPVFSLSLASGIVLAMRSPWIVVWAIACTAISIGAFILNELVDRTDVDSSSWNPIHIGKTTRFNMNIAWSLYVGFTILGLTLASRIGLFGWALVMTVWGGLYSWKPVRLKVIAVLDIVTQAGAGLVIPFGAPFFVTGSVGSAWSIILSMVLMCWTFLFPYQLADYSADKKAGFHNTHVLLGVNKSLWFNILLGVSGIVLFFAGMWHVRAPWLSVFPVLSSVLIMYELHWLQLRSIQKQEAAFQKYVGWIKPLTQLLVPYIIVLWFVW